MPPGCARVTRLPLGPASPTVSTEPYDAAYTGVPVLAPKSTPLCGMTTCKTGCMRCGLKRDDTRPPGIGERQPPW